MPQFHHKTTGLPAIFTGDRKLTDSSVQVNKPGDIPDWEWNELKDLAVEACFDNQKKAKRNEPNKERMFYFLSAFNGGNLGFWATRFESGFPKNLGK